MPAVDWDRIPELEWSVYQEVISHARALEIRCAFGGAFAAAAYTGQLRNTKDFDLYILPRDRGRMIEALHRAGLRDYYERAPYDRSWIYRGSRGEVLVDAIWQMANARATVDEEWLTRGPAITIRGERVRAIPVEELIWSKLYVLQRERSDWPDILNLIDAQTDAIDWDRLIERLAGDSPLLQSVLLVYAWLAPDRRREIPPEVWQRLELAYSEADHGRESVPHRAELLDSRPWFRVV
jgi:Nucleotidyl transferase of unknown function (DUF2204)